MHPVFKLFLNSGAQMRTPFKHLFNAASVADLVATYVWPVIGVFVTMLLGHLQGLPLMYIWLGILIAVAAILNIKHRADAPTSRKREKREAFYAVCAEVFRITEDFQGDKEPFFSALNRARLVFADDKDVQLVFSKLNAMQGHDSLLVPEVIQAMGHAVKINVKQDQFYEIPVPAGASAKT